MRTFAPALLCLAACSTPATEADVASSDAASEISTTDSAQDTGFPGADASDAMDATAPAPADFNVSGYITILCMGNAPLSACRVAAAFSLSDGMLMPVDAISVTVNDVALSHAAGGTYLGNLPTYAGSYRVVITRTTETISRTFVLPSDYSVTLTPAMPAPNTRTTLTWTPANEPNVYVATVFASGPSSPYHGSGDDTGVLAVPADAFPSAGDYVLEFQRRIGYSELPRPYTWQTNLILARQIPISVR